MTKEKGNVQRTHKDTLFQMLFREKDNLLSLYNALNRTSYTDTDSLEITTLENAIYMNYKNDISFVFGSELMLYEHQSSVNPNMPFRDLIYVTRILQGRTINQNIYGSASIRLPAPKFIVFYNGTTRQPEKQILRLSALYDKEQERPDLELIVTVYNINYGHNKELMDCCQVLKEYAEFVEQVRKFARKMPVPDAVDNAVDYCIKHNILRDFLLKNRAEVIDVCIFEYNEELHLKSVKEEGIEEGEKKGIEKGIEKGIQIGHDQGIQEGIEIGRDQGTKAGIEIGEARFARLLQTLNEAGRSEDASRAIVDPEYRAKLYRELQ